MVTQRLAGRRALRADTRGQAVVEFALIVPLFLLLVFGVWEFGRAWQVYHTLTDAAREGGRAAVVANPNFTVDSVAAKINRNLQLAALDTARAIKTITNMHGGTGTQATVSISYPYQLRWLQPFVGWTGAQASFNMNTSVVFRNEM